MRKAMRKVTSKYFILGYMPHNFHIIEIYSIFDNIYSALTPFLPDLAEHDKFFIDANGKDAEPVNV